jgi:hypothetical protein
MDLGDFLVQIPSGLILMVCGSGLLFVISLLIIAQRHNRRKIRRDSAVMGAVLTPDNPLAEAPAKVPSASTGPGLLSRTWKSVHDFFFYSEDERAERERAKAQAVMAVDPPASGISAPPDAVEVLHLWRDVVDGSLIIQIGEDTYRTMGDITAAGQERRFMAVLRELARIAKETADTVSVPASMPAPPLPTMPDQADEAAAPVMADEESAPDDEPDLEPPTPEVAAILTAAQKETARPSLTSDVQSPYAEPEPEPLGTFFSNVRNAVRRGGKAPAKGPEAPPLSIADEIEDFLQTRLRSASPELQSRRIHVRPSMDGGVRIEVDGQFFETVGDIAEEDVRIYVIDTIQTWEEMH